MASVTFLGTGPGNVMAGRFQSSLILECAGAVVLLDAGEPCSGRLLELGFALDDLDAVWITHAHSDHTGGLPLLLQASWLHGRKRELPLGLPAHLKDPLMQWLEAVLLPREKLGFPLNVFPWSTGRKHDFGDLNVTPQRTTHVAMRAGSSDGPESFLFEIAGAGKRFVYSGDIGSADDLDPVLEAPIDLLVCELAHVTPEELAAKLRGRKIGALCLSHVASGLADRLDEIKGFFENELSGVDAVFLPADGERIEF